MFLKRFIKFNKGEQEITKEIIHELNIGKRFKVVVVGYDNKFYEVSIYDSKEDKELNDFISIKYWDKELFKIVKGLKQDCENISDGKKVRKIGNTYRTF